MRGIQLTLILALTTSIDASTTSDYIRSSASPPLPLDHPKLRGRQIGSVEQIVLTPFNISSTSGESYYTVTFAAPERRSVEWSDSLQGDSTQAMQHRVESHSHMYSALNWFDHAPGKFDKESNLYSSPLLYSAVIGPLQADSRYAYRVSQDDRVFHFKTVPKPSKSSTLNVVVAGDVGQTKDSQTTFRHMLDQVQRDNVPLMVHVGDISYADGFHPRWDSYGRFAEFVHARLPVLATGGNHELENGESWVAYLHRFPMPYRQTSPSPLWYSYTAGPVHFVVLCSYAASGLDSGQYRWARADLAGVDRSRTPWVVVNMHGPFFGSNKAHKNEDIPLKPAFAPLFEEYQVDIVLAGHVHAYERTHPMRNGEMADCGTVHITIGDGGNREGPSSEWKKHQPEWSAYRESSFGYGSLSFLSEDTASWQWHRNEDEEANVADHAIIKRCSDRHDVSKIE